MHPDTPSTQIDPDLQEKLLVYQCNEITEHQIYGKLAAAVKSPENRRILERIAEDERQHYDLWRAYTGQDVEPDQGQVRKYHWISRIFGFIFGVKLMEHGETDAQENYAGLHGVIPEIDAVIS